VILVDTSVWIAHFRADVPELGQTLIDQQVLTHPFIIGELACGNLRDRADTLAWLRRLPAAVVARDSEVMSLIEARHLWRSKIGWVDAHLLASALMSDCQLWSQDRPLREAAARLKLSSSLR
jgi:predicted nucleic acid-binding protein